MLVVVCLGMTRAQAQDELDPLFWIDQIHLPTSVRLRVVFAEERVSPADPGDDRYQSVTEYGPGWMLMRNIEHDGIVGDVTLSVLVDNGSEYRTYAPLDRRGVRSPSRLESGNTAVLEGMSSPIGWVRWIRADTSECRVTVSDSRVVLQSPNRKINFSRDPVRVLEASSLNPDGSLKSRTIYSEYHTLDNGTELPMRIDYSIRRNGEVTTDRTYRVIEIEMLDPARAAPELPVFPADAIVMDAFEGRTYWQGTGETVPKGPPPGAVAPSKATAAALSPRDEWLIGGGVGVLILAGMVWRIKRGGA